MHLASQPIEDSRVAMKLPHQRGPLPSKREVLLDPTVQSGPCGRYKFTRIAGIAGLLESANRLIINVMIEELSGVGHELGCTQRLKLRLRFGDVKLRSLVYEADYVLLQL